jgi:hypothetical protein
LSIMGYTRMDAMIFGIAFLYISSHVDRNNSSGCMQADKSDSFWQQLLHRSPGHRQLHITDGQPPVLSSHSNCGFTSDNCQHEMKQTSWQSQPCTFLRRCRHRWGEASQHANKLAKSTSRLPPTNNKHQKNSVHDCVHFVRDFLLTCCKFCLPTADSSSLRLKRQALQTRWFPR